MGSPEPLFLQMHPKLIPNLELVWNLMLVMPLLVFSIGLFKNIMDLLEDVMDSFNKFGGFISLILSMGRFLLCGFKGKSYINWG